MDNQTFQNKKAAKDQEDYKQSEKASYYYWGMLLMLLFGLWTQFGQTVGIISGIFLFGLSISLKTRIVVYFLASLTPLTIGIIYAGWAGVIGGGVFSIFVALICGANYNHASTDQELDRFNEGDAAPVNSRMQRRGRG